MLRCKSCGGTYNATQADGTVYFHACAPFSVAELRAGLANKTIALSPAQQQRIDAAIAADQAYISALPIGKVDDRLITAVEQALASIVLDRPNKRDENIAGVDRDGKTVFIKAAGAGVETI